MFRESRMCSQTIHYAMKGEITGMIAACNGNFINPGRAALCSLENAVTTSFGTLLNTSKTCCIKSVSRLIST